MLWNKKDHDITAVYQTWKIQITHMQTFFKGRLQKVCSLRLSYHPLFLFLFFRSKKYTEREASPYGEKQWSPEEGSRNIPWVLTRQPDIWSALREKRPHPHMEIYFCIPNCWGFSHTTCLTHRKGKGTNIHQCQLHALGCCTCIALKKIFVPCFESARSSHQACLWKAHGDEHQVSTSDSLHSPNCRQHAELMPSLSTSSCVFTGTSQDVWRGKSMCERPRSSWLSICLPIALGGLVKGGHQDKESCSLWLTWPVPWA